MSIDLNKEDRTQAIASIQRYFEQHMEEPIGNLGAGSLLSFFLEEIGPLVYNQAVADAQTILQRRVEELEIDVHETPFQYWSKFDRSKKK